jgi:hypothetical protein
VTAHIGLLFTTVSDIRGHSGMLVQQPQPCHIIINIIIVITTRKKLGVLRADRSSASKSSHSASHAKRKGVKRRNLEDHLLFLSTVLLFSILFFIFLLILSLSFLQLLLFQMVLLLLLFVLCIKCTSVRLSVGFFQHEK